MILELKTSAAMLAAGTFGVFATAAPIAEGFGWLRTVAELGSFGLVAFSAIMLLVKVAPAFINHLDASLKSIDGSLRDINHNLDKK